MCSNYIQAKFQRDPYIFGWVTGESMSKSRIFIVYWYIRFGDAAYNYIRV